MKKKTTMKKNNNTTKSKPTTKEKAAGKGKNKTGSKAMRKGTKSAARKVHGTKALLKSKPMRKLRQMAKKQAKARPSWQTKSQKAPRAQEAPRPLFDTKRSKAGTVVTLGVSDPNHPDLHHASVDIQAEWEKARIANEVVETRSFKNQMKAAQNKQPPIKQPPVHAWGHGRNSRPA